MSISLRSLIAYVDPFCDSNLKRLVSRRIDESSVAEQLLARIKSVAGLQLDAPGLVNLGTKSPADPVMDQTEGNRKSYRDELDPNLVAEYLDHQLDTEEQEKFESICIASDVYLAEVVCCYTILATVLQHPANTSVECRSRLYQIDEPKLELEEQSVAEVEIPDLKISNETIAAEKKRVRESLDQWKQQRSNRLKIAMLMIVFLVGGAFVWRNREQIGDFNFNNSKAKSTSPISLDDAPLFQDSLSPSDWENSEENYLYEKLENPNDVLAKADPDLVAPNKYGTIQVSGTVPVIDDQQTNAKRKPPILYGKAGLETP